MRRIVYELVGRWWRGGRPHSRSRARQMWLTCAALLLGASAYIETGQSPDVEGKDVSMKIGNDSVGVVESAVVTETIAFAKIEISALNPRKDYDGDLTSLIKSLNETKTPLQPIVLRRRTEGGYEVIFGTRRFRALGKIRGEEGVLNAGEFQIVDWDDDRCILAAVTENREREDLSPKEEGLYLETMAAHLKARGEKVSDEMLEKLTGIDRPRINDLRALSNKWDKLPASWRFDLGKPANCRLGDNEERPTITPTHWRCVRKQVGKDLPDQVLKLMEIAAVERWSVSKLKEQLEALGKKDEQPGDGSAGDDPAGKEGGKPDKEPVNERDPEAEPDYRRVLKGLDDAYRWIGTDDELAKPILDLIHKAEPLAKRQAETAKQAALGKQAEEDAVSRKAIEAQQEAAEKAEAEKARVEAEAKERVKEATLAAKNAKAAAKEAKDAAKATRKQARDAAKAAKDAAKMAKSGKGAKPAAA